MYPTSAIALFCEDIRVEQNSVITMVGVMSDNVHFALPSGEQGDAVAQNLLSKLCIYVRINFDPDATYQSGQVRLVFPDDTVHEMAHIDPSTLNQARGNAKTKGNPLAGLITRVVLMGFPKTGLLKVEAVLDDQTFLAGTLNFSTQLPMEGPLTSSTAH